MGAVLHVCVTCRAGRTLADGEVPPGALLHEALIRAETSAAIRDVKCLAACERGCAAAIEAPGKWRVLLGNLDASLAADLLDYAALYDASPTGMVLPSKRAPSLRHAVLGRLPA